MFYHILSVEIVFSGRKHAHLFVFSSVCQHSTGIRAKRYIQAFATKPVTQKGFLCVFFLNKLMAAQQEIVNLCLFGSRKLLIFNFGFCNRILPSV